MQHEITQVCRLLDEKGELLEKGFSKKMLLSYHRDNIKAGSLRIKEWDYYLIYNKNYAVALTVADNSYMGLISASVINFSNPSEKTTSIMSFMTNGKFNLPESSVEGDLVYEDKKVSVKFLHKRENRQLEFNMKNFNKKEDLFVDLLLTNEPEESMCIATPFAGKKHHFYYNQKIVGMKAEGTVKVGELEIKFDSADSVAILDWGRGVWTYKNTWYWGAGAQEIAGKMFGFNIGYGFGDTSSATENMVFFDGKAHKLDQVLFEIPKTENGKDDFLKPWKFTSNDKRFEMDFEPIINRHSNTNAIVISSNQNQVFGKFNGFAVLDDGTKIEVKDMIGFAEKVMNKW